METQRSGMQDPTNAVEARARINRLEGLARVLAEEADEINELLPALNVQDILDPDGMFENLARAEVLQILAEERGPILFGLIDAQIALAEASIKRVQLLSRNFNFYAINVIGNIDAAQKDILAQEGEIGRMASFSQLAVKYAEDFAAEHTDRTAAYKEKVVEQLLTLRAFKDLKLTDPETLAKSPLSADEETQKGICQSIQEATAEVAQRSYDLADCFEKVAANEVRVLYHWAEYIKARPADQESPERELEGLNFERQRNIQTSTCCREYLGEGESMSCLAQLIQIPQAAP